MLIQLKAKSSNGLSGFFYDGSVEKAAAFALAMKGTWLDVVYHFNTGDMVVGSGFYTVIPNTWVVIYPALHDDPVDVSLFSIAEFDKKWEIIK